jgi:hypothetical protein
MPPEIREISGQFADIMVVTELRGAYPNVPIAADVDYAALVAGEDQPMFVTLPIAKVNTKSGNGRYYDEAFAMELMRQTLENKPIGLFGHLSDAERETSFKPESVHWVGAVREGDTIWGKGMVIGEAKQRIARYKASGKALATSIDAIASGQWDESLGAYRMDATTLRLGQIDFAPADRAGIPALARVPMLTTEMQAPADDADVMNNEQEPEMDKLTVIQELTEADARLLPEPVRAAIVATVPTPAEVATVATIRETLGLDARADVAGHITEMKRVQAEQAQAAITSRITELVNDGIKLDDVRPLVTELVQARNPRTVAEAEAAYAAVAATESVTKLLAARVVETMGPAQRTPVQGKQGSRYFQIPKAA